MVPLALSGANATVGAVASMSLVGGPVAALAAATGAVVLGTIAAARSRRPNERRDARRAAARAAGRAASAGAGGVRSGRQAAGRLGAGGLSVGRGNRAGGGRASGSRAGGSRAGGWLSKVPGQHRRASAAVAGGATGRKPGGVSLVKRAAGAAGGKGAGRLRQVRELRAAQRAAGGSRAEQRARTTAARRAVADARRQTAAHRSAGAAVWGGSGRLRSAAAGRLRAARDAAIARHRARRDAARAARLDAYRDHVRKAAVRKAARKALHRSAARFHGRRLLAALLALPLGLLGMVTTPLGRKLGWAWLMHPGRRLYGHLVRVAGEERAERDAAIRADLAAQEEAADREAEQGEGEEIADKVERPDGAAATSGSAPHEQQQGGAVSVSGFRFEEVAAEMEQAAQQYEPENAMEILAMVEGLPAALTSVANVMKILAERSDSEFPLEKVVADGFNDIYGALNSAVAVAEDLGPLFRQAHEQDIARHEDPRNGYEAEKGWNV